MAKSTSKPRSKAKPRAKTTTRKPVTHNQTHILVKKGLIGYSILLFFAFILVSLSIYSITQVMDNRDRIERSEHIWSVYQSLGLDDSYRGVTTDILDQKYVYEWDDSRSKSSEATFVRVADRPDTFADLKQRIEAAGFEQIEGPDYGEAARQDHYQNSDGVYIRVSVDTKASRDALVYGTELPEADSPERLTDGPVFITIKVNLDDNNE